MNKFIFILALVCATCRMPINAWANTNTETVGESPNPIIKYISGSNVNVHQSPDINSEIINMMQINDEIETYASTDGWDTIILDNGNFGYVSSDYVSNEKVELKSYTDEDLYVLAHLLCGEAHTYPDEEQLYVGSVVLNRVARSDFPNTIKGVAYDRKHGIQYACVWDGNYNRTPTERNWANAKYLLEHGSVLPEYVYLQSRSRLGKVYVKTKYHYYCY